MKRFHWQFKSLWRKFVFYFISVAIVAFGISTLVSLRAEQVNLENEMRTDLKELLNEASLSYAEPLWDYNYSNLNLLSKTFLNRKSIYRLQLFDNTRGLILDQNKTQTFGNNAVVFAEQVILKNKTAIGKIRITMNPIPYEEQLYRHLLDRGLSALFQIMLVTGLIIWITYTITKPLKALELNMMAFSEGEDYKPLNLHGNDEMAHLSTAFNTMAQTLEEADIELRTMNASLEQLVLDRTEELRQSNSALKDALDEAYIMQEELSLKNEALNDAMARLQTAYEEIIEASKSNITSQLISGVAHEINNPLGVMLTGNSFLMQEIQDFEKLFKEDTLKKSDLEAFLSTLTTMTHAFQRNLDHTAALVQNFKKVSVDQTSLRQRTFQLREYLLESLATLKPAFKGKAISVTLDCPEGIEIISYPGAYSQIITNLVMNSLIHGFKDLETGDIMIGVSVTDEALTLVYTDNGLGIPQENLPHIFTPFFSTAHNTGGSGLGLSVIKHLAEDMLEGSITVDPTPSGVSFTLVLPIKKSA